MIEMINFVLHAGERQGSKYYTMAALINTFCLAALLFIQMVLEKYIKLSEVAANIYIVSIIISSLLILSTMYNIYRMITSVEP